MSICGAWAMIFGAVILWIVAMEIILKRKGIVWWEENFCYIGAGLAFIIMALGLLHSFTLSSDAVVWDYVSDFFIVGGGLSISLYYAIVAALLGNKPKPRE